MRKLSVETICKQILTEYEPFFAKNNFWRFMREIFEGNIQFFLLFMVSEGYYGLSQAFDRKKSCGSMEFVQVQCKNSRNSLKELAKLLKFDERISL